MKDIRDLTTEAFGLIIAFLIPGLAGLFSLSLWSPTVKEVFITFTSEKANINLFLLIILAALGIGLLVTALRGFIFERLLVRGPLKTGHSTSGYKVSSIVSGLLYNSLFIKVTPLSPDEFKPLDNPDTFAAFTAINDAFYRYHQCWSGLAVVLPVLYLGWLKNSWTLVSINEFSRRAEVLFTSVLHNEWLISFWLILKFTDFLGFFVPAFAFLAAETASVWAAKIAYIRYVERARSILTSRKESIMPNGHGVIVIKGGSVTVEFDVSELVSLGSGGGVASYSNSQKVIKRIEVRADGLNIIHQVSDPKDITIKVYYDNP